MSKYALLKQAFIAGNSRRVFTTIDEAGIAFDEWWKRRVSDAVDFARLSDRQISNVVHGRDADDNGEFTASSMGAAHDAFNSQGSIRDVIVHDQFAHTPGVMSDAVREHVDAIHARTNARQLATGEYHNAVDRINFATDNEIMKATKEAIANRETSRAERKVARHKPANLLSDEAKATSKRTAVRAVEDFMKILGVTALDMAEAGEKR